MKKKFVLLKQRKLGWAGIAGALVISTTGVRAQLPTPTPPPATPPYAVITYSQSSPGSTSPSVVAPSANGIFSPVGLQPNAVVLITVQYPSSQALQTVNLEAVDGGTIVGSASQVSTLIIGQDGTLHFTFKAAGETGRNNISLRQGAQGLGLQFWVLDQQYPGNNPPTITPDHPFLSN